MLESIKDKLFSTANPRRLSDDKGSCNLNAGGTLLAKYQNDWIKLHTLNEENAKNATEVDVFITKIVNSCEEQWKNVSNLTSQFSSLRSLKESMADLCDKLETLETSFEEVENALITLGNVIEIQNLQEKQLDERFKLALHKEKKFSEFEVFKSKLKAEHVNKVIQFEAQKQSLLQERQEAFRVAFEEEMEHYKQCGHVEKVVRVRGSGEEEIVKLEDIELDQENNILDDFFATEAVEFEFSRASGESSELSNEGEKA